MTSLPAAAGVVIPIRAFADAKSRLAPRLTENERSRLMQAMAERVVAAAAPMPVAVVSSAPEVVGWATALHLELIPDPGSLDGAADAGREWARGIDAARVVVAHADLPLVESLAALAEPRSEPVAVIVPCHRDDGTPLLSLPVDALFRFSYGPGSFDRHVVEAVRAGLEVLVIRDDPRLRRDVDSIDDLDAVTELTR